MGKVSSDRLMAAVHGSLDQGGGGRASSKYLSSQLRALRICCHAKKDRFLLPGYPFFLLSCKFLEEESELFVFLLTVNNSERD